CATSPATISAAPSPACCWLPLSTLFPFAIPVPEGAASLGQRCRLRAIVQIFLSQDAIPLSKRVFLVINSADLNLRDTMSIRGLRALHAVANHASFADAAASLNVTPSAISMQISALEEALGTLLFDRSRRPPRMTRTGELVLRYAQTIVKDYDAMLAEVATTD